jgi:hypothetical protein
MDAQSLQPLLTLMAANLWVTITCILVVIIHSGVLAWQARGTRASLERIEASAERITQMAEHVAAMVRDLHRR